MHLRGIGYALLGVLLVGFMPFVLSSETMIVGVNVMNSTLSEQPVSVVGLQVPDYVFFGNLTKGEQSDELQVTVNNTGNVDLSVTPRLTNSSEKIFNYTYFRLYKTSGGQPVPFSKIGNFTFNVNEGSHKYFYMKLDLTDYPEDIPQDMINHQAEITFIAMQQ